MLTGDEIESLPIGLEKLFRGLEKRVMRDIIRRLKAAGEITRSTDWQIYRSAELGKAIDEIKKEIAETLDGGDDEVERLFDEAAKTSWARDKKLYKSVGQTPIAYKDNETLKQLVAAVKAQTSDELRNITGTLGVATANKGRIKTVSLTEYFTDTLDNAALDISSGAFDYNTVLKRTVTELVNSGIRTINYDSVSKRPTTARVDVAARRAVMTGVNQLTAKISEDNAKTLGTDMYEVSAHSCCRPEHVEWQGGWYTMAQLKSVCGYGRVDGLKGANCGHSFDPVIPGVSEPSYTPEELRKMRAEELKKHEYNGKEYTKYEASQRQRRLERTIAARRHAVDLLEEGGADEKTIQNARASFQAVSQEYTRFSKAMGLPQQRERVGLALAGMKYDVPTAPKPIKTNTQTVEISSKGIDKPENSVYNSNAEQLYRPVTRGASAEFNIRSDQKIAVKRVESYDDEVYISDMAEIKPKALHEIKQTTDAARDEWGIESKPKIIIVDADEMPNVFGKYDPVGNAVYYISNVDEDDIAEIAGGQGSVEYHEMWHMRQAEDFKARGWKITAENRGEYIKALCQKCKKNIERFGITYDDVGNISEYAKQQYERERYDEVEAEYYTMKRRQKR
jgi:hypothetical protein